GVLLADPLDHHAAPPVPPKAEDLANDLEKLGPTFVKLGQLLSTRADFLPPAYMAALSRLQDKVEPFPFEEVEAIIPVEIGARISKARRSSRWRSARASRRRFRTSSASRWRPPR